jgi:hypothetical protein
MTFGINRSYNRGSPTRASQKENCCAPARGGAVLTGCHCATRSLPRLRSPEEVMSMKTAQAKFALLVEILWRPERIRLLVD